MWLVWKIRLTVSIALIALLASLFLLMQVCMLDSSGYCGLSTVTNSHRRIFKSISESRLLSSTRESSNGVIERNRSGSMITDAVDVVDHVLTGINVSSTLSTSTFIEQKSGVERNKISTSLKSTSSDAHSRATPAQKVTDEASTSSLGYKQIPKSAMAMLQFWQSHHCKDPHCMEYLTGFDKECYDYCVKKGQLVHDAGMHGECRFMRGEGRAAVALASLPGSGNTWVRGLIEKATGICTGSVYCDVHLKEAGFNGEKLRSGSVIVVKTHKAKVTWTEMTKPAFNKGETSYGAVILLIRNPYKALVADWNRKESCRLNKKRAKSVPALVEVDKLASHTSSVGPEHFGTNAAWNTFIHKQMPKWISYFIHLIVESNRTTLVVLYENFQQDRVREVSRILDFIYFPYVRKSLAEKLQNDFDVFQRKQHVEFEAFTELQIEYIDRQLRALLHRLNTANSGVTFGIEEYLRNPI